MQRRLRYLVTGLAAAATSFCIVPASPAAAECTDANGVTVCAQGDVRGTEGGSGPGLSGPVVPYPCEYDWYCGNEWGLDVIVDPGPPGPPDLGRPGRPGIGPR
ncbi:hypothetical protein [Mycolicibacterium thermoresistibile]